MLQKQIIVSTILVIAAGAVLTLAVTSNRNKTNDITGLLNGFYQAESYAVQMAYADEEDSSVVSAYYTKDQGLVYVEDEEPYRFSFLKQDIYKGLDDTWTISLPEEPRAIPGSAQWLLGEDVNYFSNGKVSWEFDQEGCLELELGNNCSVIRLKKSDSEHWVLYFSQSQQQIACALQFMNGEATAMYIFGLVNDPDVVVENVFDQYKTEIETDVSQELD